MVSEGESWGGCSFGGFVSMKVEACRNGEIVGGSGG